MFFGLDRLPEGLEDDGIVKALVASITDSVGGGNDDYFGSCWKISCFWQSGTATNIR